MIGSTEGIRLEELARIVGGTLLVGDPQALVGPASIDTRIMQPGELFVALPGERVDGHQFLPQAKAIGVGAALVRRGFAAEGFEVPEGLALVEVQDVQDGLWAYAQWARSQRSPRVIGVTGSNGKTTVKEMLSSILAVAAGQDAVLRNRLNFNNHLGVPLTLTRLNGQHRYAVIEMGMNHPGEIAELAGLVRPVVGVITSIGHAHLEGLGGIEQVARAKAELFQALPEAGCAVFPDGQPILEDASGHVAKQIRFGSEQDCRVQVISARSASTGALSVELRIDENVVEATLHVAGVHNAFNAAAAAGAAVALHVMGEAIHDGLERFVSAPHRSVVRRCRGAWVLDDCYNANPTSMVAGIEALATLPGAGRRGAILGDMAELGPGAAKLHRDVIGAALQAGLDRLILVGPLMQRAAVDLDLVGTRKVDVVESAQEAGNLARDRFGDQWRVLVKASRVTGLERALDRWCSGEEGR